MMVHLCVRWAYYDTLIYIMELKFIPICIVLQVVSKNTMVLDMVKTFGAFIVCKLLL